MWTGLQGIIGALVPFVSREDVDFIPNARRVFEE